MNNFQLHKKTRRRLRSAGAALFGILVGFSTVASALAADVVTLRVGDQKGGNRACSKSQVLPKTSPTRSSGPNFPRRRQSSKR
jgi:sulfonate transport system substrate-binding protein